MRVELARLCFDRLLLEQLGLVGHSKVLNCHVTVPGDAVLLAGVLAAVVQIGEGRRRERVLGRVERGLGSCLLSHEVLGRRTHRQLLARGNVRIEVDLRLVHPLVSKACKGLGTEGL